jgi:hypothetical protein
MVATHLKGSSWGSGPESDRVTNPRLEILHIKEEWSLGHIYLKRERKEKRR